MTTGQITTTQRVHFGMNIDMTHDIDGSILDMSSLGYSHPYDSPEWSNTDSGFACWNEEQQNFDCHDYQVLLNGSFNRYNKIVALNATRLSKKFASSLGS